MLAATSSIVARPFIVSSAAWRSLRRGATASPADRVGTLAAARSPRQATTRAPSTGRSPRRDLDLREIDEVRADRPACRCTARPDGRRSRARRRRSSACRFEMAALTGDSRFDVNSALHHFVDRRHELRGVARRIPHRDPDERVARRRLDQCITVAIPSVRGADRSILVASCVGR